MGYKNFKNNKNLLKMPNNPPLLAKILRTPKFKQRKIESKKKYKRKKRVNGYYYDYDGKERILYDDNC